MVARHRRAEGLERTQLRWLLWAGVVCLLSVAVMFLVPEGALTTAVLVAALGATAASVTIGIVRPELADVDALVAGTLTYAGVAAVVVAIDLAALAAAGAWLGDRMDERDVSLLVLVLAVAVYGPLRAWLGAGVRRLMFGRRGDRYDVIMATAVWMHMDAAQRRQSMRHVAELLAPGGLLFLTLRHGPVPDGRRMFDVPADETIALGRGHGLALLHRNEREDMQNRPDVRWTCLVLRRGLSP